MLKRAGDILAALAILIAAVGCLEPVRLHKAGGMIYVSPGGHDWNTGQTIDHAVTTIGRAARLVLPGDTVVILPGIYREQIRVRHGGRSGKPVVFRAQQPGTVVITSEAPPQCRR